LKPDQIQHLMALAIKEAKESLPIDVPVGAIFFDDEANILAQNHNQREKLDRISGHAEILALEDLKIKQSSSGLNLVTTLEPCMMCAGAIKEAGVKRVYYGVKSDDKEREQVYDIMLEAGIEYYGGILETENLELLRDFFQKLR